MFFFPEGGGYFIEMANFQEANPLVTPDHIAPVWYYAPFYTMLRAIPDPLGGLIVMAAAVAIFLLFHGLIEVRSHQSGIKEFTAKLL